MRDIWADEPVPDEQPFWKYLKVNRFVDSVQSARLYFAAARQFEDPFEGAVAVLSEDFPVDPRYVDPEPGERAFEELRRLTKVSCWHCADFESDAMWKLYAGARKGVAIRTTADRLRTALQPYRIRPEYGEEEPCWGTVRYVDLLNTRLRVGMLERFFYKHRAFEWEREFRVAISVRSAEEFAVQVPEHGIEVGFDPDTLLESVYIGPDLTAPERDEITQTLDQAGLTSRLVVSSLLGRPRYV